MVYSQSAPPPLNSNHDTTLRGMYVSCGDELILELFRNSNLYDSTDCSRTPKLCGLVNFCNSRFINYVAVYSLGKRHSGNDPNPIVGNMVFFNAVKRFLQVMHDNSIKVGIVISNKEFLDTLASSGTFVTSDFFWEEPNLPWDDSCMSLAKGVPNNSIATASFPDYDLLNPSPSCTEEECPAQYILSEMLKQVMRVYQYSYWVRDSTIANGCVGCTARTSSTIAPADPKYLFDYMSLEYEYWDDDTYEKSDTVGLYPPKGGWNAFFHISQAMLYVYGHMCTSLKMELEWRLAPANHINGYTDPSNPGDLVAQNMLPTSMQAQYIARAFNRVLMSDYRIWSDVAYPKMINKTGNIHTQLAAWPNDLNAGDRHKLMPLFSAATVGEYKQCFDTVKYTVDNPSVIDTWDFSYFGPGLADTMTMYDYENLYMQQLETSISNDEKFVNNWEYVNSGITLDTIDTLHQDIAGFMWYNYSTLRNVWRDTVEYNRQSNTQLFVNQTLPAIYFNTNSSVLNFKGKENESKMEAFLQVINMQGEEVFKMKIISVHQSITLQQIPSGIYLCKLSDGQSYRSKKITILK
ncbi:MAG: T9SS type A sorting domain-containing protein [Bacteroidetes bacterium]|nr:T9SS type A sorting domain-containing protein [Bacteroidota bacterium]